jgi:hypothetical protein
VVIPFRAARDDGRRVRNLAAAVNALSDQSFPRQRYRIVVAEGDAVPRWRHLFDPACDAYVFVPCPGRFSKSWTVNAGVALGAGAAGLICVLDGDILVDSDFIGRGSPALKGRAPQRTCHFVTCCSSTSGRAFARSAPAASKAGHGLTTAG